MGRLNDTPFSIAIKMAIRIPSGVEVIKLLVRAGADLHDPKSEAMVNAKTTKTDMFPLHLAALTAQTDVVRRLLSSGTDPSVISTTKTTSIRLAMCSNRPSASDTIRCLLAAGASIDCTNWPRCISMFHLLCYNSSFSESYYVDLIQCLLSAGEDINGLTVPDSTTPLMAAAAANNFTVIPHMLRYGADINHQDLQGGYGHHGSHLRAFI